MIQGMDKLKLSISDNVCRFKRKVIFLILIFRVIHNLGINIQALWYATYEFKKLKKKKKTVIRP